MAPQTASAFLLLGIILIFIRVRNRAASLAIDFLVSILCSLEMIVVSGYVYGVMHLFGVSPSTRTSPHTLLVLILLSFVAFSRRAETGFYSVFIGAGIGGKIARVAAPLSLGVPFALETARFGIARIGILSPQYATALITALASIAGFAIILSLAWRNDSLEQEIRELSLRDDLTRLYNRRGFFLIAEQQLRMAQRAQAPFSVLFLDLDGLKQVNDRLGHETGSDFLREIAALILKCFRESDVAGRIGGDEFVVAGVASEAGMAQASQHLRQATTDRNAQPGHECTLEFSVGIASWSENRPESLEELVKRADEAMYLAKRAKRQSRP